MDRYLDICASRVALGDLSEATLASYASDLRDFVGLIGEAVLADDVTGEDIDTALVSYAKAPDGRYVDPEAKAGAGHGVGSQMRFRAAVDVFFRHCEKHAWVQMSPMHFATVIPRRRGGLRQERTSLSPEQATALLRYGAGPEPSQEKPRERYLWLRDRCILATLAVVGPRVSEMTAATVEQFGMRDGVETWRIVGKGGKVRHVPLSPWLSDLKREMIAAAPPSTGRWVWRSINGNRITSRDVQRLLERAHGRVRDADPGNARLATPHALRHTCVSLLLSAGWDIKLVKQLLGHSSLATTGVYLDELPGELAAAVARHPLTPTSR